MSTETSNRPRARTVHQRLLELERGQDLRRLILAAYQQTGTLKGTAAELGISRPTLDEWIRDLGGEITLRFEDEP